MPSRFELVYKVKRDIRGIAEGLFPEFFDTRFRDIDDRLIPLEEVKISWEEALTVVQDRVLTRSEAVIAELRDRLLAITQLQWLTAGSGTSARLVAGAPGSLMIDVANRALFAPGPFAIVGRTGDPASYAIVRTLAYGRETTGQWDFTVEAVVGDLSAPHADWAIGAIAGSSLVQLAWLSEAKALRQSMLDAQAATLAAAAAAANDKLVAGLNRSAAEQAAATATEQATAAKGSADRAALFDPSNYYAKAAVDQKLADQAAAIKGTADTAHDSFGELQTLVDANTAAVATAASMAARALRAGRLSNSQTHV